MVSISLLMVTKDEVTTYLPFALASIETYIGKDQIEEFIIWDNASGKTQIEALKLLNRQEKVTVVFSKENLYDLPAINEAMRLIKTEFVFYLNSHTRVFAPVDFQEMIEIFNCFPNAAMFGNPGPCLSAKAATPDGVSGWGWVPRLLVEREFFESMDEDTAHVQTWAFLTKPEIFFEIGGFRIRTRRFDMRWPERRFEPQPFCGDKGDLIAAEIEFGVRARRMGFQLLYPRSAMDFPFYHYPSGLTRAEILRLETRFQPVFPGDWLGPPFQRLP